MKVTTPTNVCISDITINIKKDKMFLHNKLFFYKNKKPYNISNKRRLFTRSIKIHPN